MPSYMRNSQIDIHDHLHDTTGLALWPQYRLSEYPFTFSLAAICSQGSVGLSRAQSGALLPFQPRKSCTIVRTLLADNIGAY